MRIFPDYIEAFEKYTEDVESSPLFLKWSIISAIGAALERKVWVNWMGSFEVAPNNFIFIIGPSGFRKSTAAKEAVAILKETGRVKFMAQKTNQAAMFLDIKSAQRGRKVTVDGVSYPHASAYLFASEASDAIPKDSAHGSLKEFLTNIYDIDKWNKNPSYVKTTRMAGDEKIYNHCMNMLACSTPDWLPKVFTEDDLAGGFASRCLFVVDMERSPRFIPLTNENLDFKKKFFYDLVDDMKQISQLSGQYSFDEDFLSLYNEIRIENAKLVMKKQSDKMVGYYGRRDTHLMKLSMIIQASRGSDMVLKRSSLEKAVELLKGIEPSMNECFIVSSPIKIFFNAIKDIDGEFTMNTILKNTTSLNMKDREIYEHVRKLVAIDKMTIRPTGQVVLYSIKDQNLSF